MPPGPLDRRYGLLLQLNRSKCRTRIKKSKESLSGKVMKGYALNAVRLTELENRQLKSVLDKKKKSLVWIVECSTHIT